MSLEPPVALEELMKANFCLGVSILLVTLYHIKLVCHSLKIEEGSRNIKERSKRQKKSREGNEKSRK